MAIKKHILITGGGSVGKAFVRLLHDKHHLTVIDSNEWVLAEIKDDFPKVKIKLMDYADWVYQEDPCEVIIHTAAYKHVNFGEVDTHAFIENNITKLEKLIKEANKYNVDIVFTSTDKAVEPISVYGATKMIGEALIRNYENGYVVRMGNILSSTGSVIPVWENCIKEAKPIPITDERMTRYVIEDYAAVDQIWDQYNAGNKLIIPLCEEVRIMDMLADVLFRHGFDSPADYAPGVHTIGLRPGEKLSEKLRWDNEL
jgi:FlaA1/EpsC-like NDP-sugar epimerase